MDFKIHKGSWSLAVLDMFPIPNTFQFSKAAVSKKAVRGFRDESLRISHFEMEPNECWNRADAQSFDLQNRRKSLSSQPQHAFRLEFVTCIPMWKQHLSYDPDWMLNSGNRRPFNFDANKIHKWNHTRSICCRLRRGKASSARISHLFAGAVHVCDRNVPHQTVQIDR